MSDHALASHALGHKAKSKSPKKNLKEFHAKELHDGTYHIARNSGKPEPPKEGSGPDLDAVHDALEEHMGQPNDGEAEAPAAPAEAPAGEQEAQ